MAKPKYLISEVEFAELRKKASKEYYENRILKRPKTKSLTPLAKNVHNIRIQRRAHEKECMNEHFKKACRISCLRYDIKRFRENATLYEAEKFSRWYSDIIPMQRHSSVTAFLSMIKRIKTSTGSDAYILDINGWHRVSLYYTNLDDDECGKWMCFFRGDNFDWASSITEMAVVQGICESAKCSLPTHLNSRGSGVICLYGENFDYDFHKRCTQFMIDHNMIQKTRKGSFYNISFKMDWMTQLYIYGETGKIQLSDLRNLETGEWIYDGENASESEGGE